MSEQKAPKAKRQRAEMQTKPIYLVYMADSNGELQIVAASRKADIALKAIDENPGAKYKRVELAD